MSLISIEDEPIHIWSDLNDVFWGFTQNSVLVFGWDQVRDLNFILSSVRPF